MSVKAKVITAHNDIKLIEWIDQRGYYLRAWVTPDMIEQVEGQLAQVNNPEMGIPYGQDWAELIEQSITPAMVANSLRRSGIWTIEDLLSRPNEVHGAVIATAGAVLQGLLSNVKQLRSNNNGS